MIIANPYSLVFYKNLCPECFSFTNHVEKYEASSNPLQFMVDQLIGNFNYEGLQDEQITELNCAYIEQNFLKKQ